MVANRNIGLLRSVLTGLAMLSLASVAAVANSLEVMVTDADGSPLENAIVTLTPTFQMERRENSEEIAEMKQQNTLFSPFVLPVQTGTRVSFPNLDESRHHVYSFSPAKRFELRLYGKDENNWILFDQPGVVALGCNIHDNMLAYIYVTDAPIYRKSGADGSVAFAELQAGSYEVAVWHPGQRSNGAPEPELLEIRGDKSSHAASIRLRRVWGQQRPPSDGQY